MAVLAWVILGIAFVSFLIASAGFRIAVVVVVGAFGALIFWKDHAEDEERQASLTRIAADEIVLQDLSLSNSYSSYKIAGRLKNMSREYAVDWLSLKVSMHDCPSEQYSASCVTIGEGTMSYSSPVPPGQARDFNEYVSFDNASFKPTGNLVWTYAVDRLKGK